MRSSLSTTKMDSNKTPTFKRRYKVGLQTSNSSSIFSTSPELYSVPSVFRSDTDKKSGFSPILHRSSFDSSLPKLESHRKSVGSCRVTQILGISNQRSKSVKLRRPDDDSDEYLKKLLEKSDRRKNMYADEDDKNTVGLDAVTGFYSHYKKLDKIIDQNDFGDIKDSIYTTCLRKENTLRLFPSKIGIIKDRGERSHILIK